MITKITFSEFEQLIGQLHPLDFENLIFDILSSLPNIDSIEQNSIAKNRQFDIVFTENLSQSNIHNTYKVVEIKSYKSSVPSSVIEQFYTKVKISLGDSYKMLFVTTSSLTRSAQQFAKDLEIEIWTIREIFSRINEKILLKYYSKNNQPKISKNSEVVSKGKLLIQNLRKIKPGKKEWSQYQQTIFDIVEYLFCPPLEIPHYELIDSDSRNRRDIVLENDGKQEFWKSIRDIYQGYYIVIDAKNYSKKLTKRPIIDIAHYLKPYGCGMFGIIVCREGNGKSSDHAIREQWIGNNKMIVVLSDNDIIEMLEMKEDGSYPEAIIRKKIANFRMKL